MAVLLPDDDLFPARRMETGAEDSREEADDEFDAQVQRAQEQILRLRRQQEAIERRKRELEELGRKQAELDHGRNEMTDLLRRSLVQIERDAYEVEKKAETLRQARELFALHLGRLEEIDPRVWEPEDVPKMLATALSQVDSARIDYEKVRVRITDGPPNDETSTLEPRRPQTKRETFGTLVLRGFALTLPLFLLGLTALILWWLRSGSP